MDNEGKLPNDFIALGNSMLRYEHQLEVPIFQPSQPDDYIRPSCSYDFLLYYGVSSLSHPFNQMSFVGVSDPLLYPVVINPYIKTKDALGGDIGFDDTPFLLPP